MRVIILVLAVIGASLALPWSTLSKVNFDRSKFAYPNEAKHRPGGRIIGGHEAANNQFPHQAGLIVSTSMTQDFCGGSLITSKCVLTAAHCVDKALAVTVILGAHNVDQNEPSQVRMDSKDFRIHEDWDSANLVNDIAVIKLPSPVKTSDAIQIVQLVSGSDSYAGDQGTVSGWGITADGQQGNSPILNYVNSKLLSNTDCKAIDPYQNIIKDTHLCMSGDGTKGTCSGDSGGPLLVNGAQVGVVSFGYKYCEADKPSVFTRLTKYADWIAKHCN